VIATIAADIAHDAAGNANIASTSADNSVAYEYINPLRVTTATDVVDWSDGLTSLREAVAYANSHVGNDAITFDSSLAGQTITLTDGQLELTDTTGETTIAGFGASKLTISGNSVSRVFFIDCDVTAKISGLTITKGNGSCDDRSGGGISNLGTLTITASTLSGNSADYGGGVGNEGTLTITASTLSGNSADYGGGVGNEGTLTITDSTISGNSADYGGGISNNWGTLTITGSTIAGNSADYGGGIGNNWGTLSITGSTLSGNSAGSYGGGIFIYGTLTITDSTMSENSADYAGGICNCGTLTISGSTMSGNSADYGGGILTMTR